MKRIIIIALAFILTVSLLAACGKVSEVSEAEKVSSLSAISSRDSSLGEKSKTPKPSYSEPEAASSNASEDASSNASENASSNASENASSCTEPACSGSKSEDPPICGTPEEIYKSWDEFQKAVENNAIGEDFGKKTNGVLYIPKVDDYIIKYINYIYEFTESYYYITMHHKSCPNNYGDGWCEYCPELYFYISIVKEDADFSKCNKNDIFTLPKVTWDMVFSDWKYYKKHVANGITYAVSYEYVGGKYGSKDRDELRVSWLQDGYLFTVAIFNYSKKSIIKDYGFDFETFNNLRVEKVTVDIKK